jgi:tetratricopeptide (TPR) repeat protein
LGYCLLLAGRKEQAAERLKRAVALRPGYVEAHFLLGTMAIDRRDGDEAEQRAKAILGQAPLDEQGRALWGLAKLLQSEKARAKGMIEQARQTLLEGRQVAPGLISLWEEALRLEVNQREWDRAQILAQQWAEMMPENFQALLTWGDLEFRRGKNEDAKRLWQRAFSLVERGSDEEKLRAVRERLAR